MFGFEMNRQLITIIVIVLVFVGLGVLVYERVFNRTELTADTVEDFVRKLCKSKDSKGSVTVSSDSTGKIGGLVYSPHTSGGSNVEIDATGKKVSSLSVVEELRPEDFGKSDEVQASLEYNQSLKNFPIEKTYSCDTF